MAEYRAQWLAILAVAGSFIAVVFSLLIIPFLTTVAQQPEGEQRRIVALDSKYDLYSGQEVTRVNYVKVGDMEPNSARWFLDPFGKTMGGSSTIGFVPKAGMILNQSEWELRDKFEAFEIYSIVRLPNFLGESQNDLPAYRAYNSIAISDQCVSKYWPQEERWHIENPCAGDFYRAWDGVATAGPAAFGISGRGIISTGQFGALASMNLSADSEGYITARRPDRGYSENGTPGEGRRLSFEQIQDSNQKMLEAASGYAGYELPFPAAISGKYYLSELRPAREVVFDYGNSKMMEAVYSSYPLAVGSGYEDIVLKSYPLENFAELALDSPVMVEGQIDLASSNLVGEALKLNQTLIKSLIGLNWYNGADDSVRITMATSEEGKFLVVIAPARIEGADDALGPGAVVWATSRDGQKEVLVTVETRSIDTDELSSLLQSLQIA